MHSGAYSAVAHFFLRRNYPRNIHVQPLFFQFFNGNQQRGYAQPVVKRLALHNPALLVVFERRERHHGRAHLNPARRDFFRVRRAYIYKQRLIAHGRVFLLGSHKMGRLCGNYPRYIPRFRINLHLGRRQTLLVPAPYGNKPQSAVRLYRLHHKSHFVRVRVKQHYGSVSLIVFGVYIQVAHTVLFEVGNIFEIFARY